MATFPVRRLPGAADAPVALLCEHASNRLPGKYAWPEEDRWLVDTHWAWDPFAATVVEALAGELNAPAVLANFSRLLADPNRPEDSPGLLRKNAEGQRVVLNHGISEAERRRRLEHFHRPFHQAADLLAKACQGPFLLSIHTFTPVYEGIARELEVGVLWEREDALNERFADILEKGGFVVGRNAPYSGKEGLAYSVERHAQAHGLCAIELELRQDCCEDPGFRERVVQTVAEFIRKETG